MSAGDFVTVSAFVAVDPAFAFEAFTSDLEAWWRKGPQYRPGRRRSGVMRLEGRVGGRVLEVYDAAGDDLFEIGRVRVWDPPARLVFTWRGTNFAPQQSTEVEVRFEPDEGGTRVTLQHRGWATLPPDHPARHGLDERAFAAMMGGWWADLLRSLRGYALEAAARRG
jgi:uncharacterized protein YndB with AHSA1/START domain